MQLIQNSKAHNEMLQIKCCCWGAGVPWCGANPSRAPCCTPANYHCLQSQPPPLNTHLGLSTLGTKDAEMKRASPPALVPSPCVWQGGLGGERRQEEQRRKDQYKTFVPPVISLSSSAVPPTTAFCLACPIAAAWWASQR